MASDFAMQAKARSLFSKHFTLDKYRSLASLKDVPSIAAYLRTDSRYQAVLETLSDKEVHREVLEQKIRLLGQAEFLKLMRYVKPGRTNFFKYYIKRREIEQILFLIHAIDSGVPYRIEYYIDKLDELMELDIARVARITSAKDLLAYLDTTSYKGVLHDALANDTIVVSLAEDALNAHYRKFISMLIRKEPNTNEIQSLFNMDDELRAVEEVYRLKKHYNMQAERINARIHYRPFFISQMTMKQWVNQYDAEGFLDAFHKSAYSRYVESSHFTAIDAHLNSIRYRIYEHHLRFATNTNLTLMSYIELVQYEINNVIDIVEGVRYGMSSEAILELITL